MSLLQNHFITTYYSNRCCSYPQNKFGIGFDYYKMMIRKDYDCDENPETKKYTIAQ